MFLLVTTTGTWTLFRQVNSPKITCRNKILNFAGVSILKPLKGADASLFENLESFFKIQTDLPFELLFSLENRKDAAYGVVLKLMERYPAAPAKVFLLEDQIYNLPESKNPKLRNINQSYEKSKYDAVWISDSNVLLMEGELEALVTELDDDAGIVTAIVSGISFEGLGGALESVFLGTFYARFMALCNRFAKPCVVGKAMLFRKSQAARFGGFKILSEFLAEDFMAGESMRKLGLKVKTSRMVVSQILGRYSVKTFWGRHVRWGRIRKSHAPLAFFAEPFFGPMPMSFLGAYALNAMTHLGFAHAFLISWTYLCFLDLLCYVRTTASPILFLPWFPVLWTLRESLSFPLWVKIASGNDIDWRGSRFKLAPGGLLSDK